MGNHEYCTDCGASDFHLGRPCDPTAKAAEQERTRKAEERHERLKTKAIKVCAELVALGYPARIGAYDAVVIEIWDLENLNIPTPSPSTH